ncbi:MAG: HAD-IC family P-type ATPase, partial [Thermoanaerobaculia bacterium]|nr:HAD-IC family P-type ATPase [Thermoanaerobaculia bacterium]
MNWHLTSIGETYQVLGSNARGLSQNAVMERLSRYGENKLPEARKKSPLLMFLAQFKDWMILILLAAAVISGVIGDLKDTIVILVIVALNAVVGFVQEYRAEKALEELKKIASAVAKVLRDGVVRHIPATQIVPGDLVLLESGDIVPADLRLVETHTLRIEEASLTGESYPVEKNTGELADESAPLGDRLNMAFKGTVVNYGRGTGLAVATGLHTEIGKIASLLQQPESRTPLQQRLADFSKKLSVVVILICGVIYGVGVLRGAEHIQMLLTAISVAVAGIPEALPAVITIALALGARKMVRKNALIRKLPAVETLGSVNYICTDKTGTLTLNKMSVREVWLDQETIQNEAFSARELLELSMLLNHDTHTNEHGEINGDATEVALVEYARQTRTPEAGLDVWHERVYEVPFDSTRKLMTTVHRFHGQFIVITKGAMESLLPLCL